MLTDRVPKTASVTAVGPAVPACVGYHYYMFSTSTYYYIVPCAVCTYHWFDHYSCLLQSLLAGPGDATDYPNNPCSFSVSPPPHNVCQGPCSCGYCGPQWLQWTTPSSWCHQTFLHLMPCTTRPWITVHSIMPPPIDKTSVTKISP